MSKKWTEEEIRNDTWGYHISMLLELDKARRWLKTEINRVRREKKENAKKLRP